MAGLAVLVKVDDTQADDFFSQWVGKTEFTLDLSKLLDKFAGLSNSFYGYRGTDTMPNCTNFMCWYVIPNVVYIHQSTFDALKAATPGVEFNNRIPKNAG